MRLFAVRPEVLFPYYNPLVDVSTRDLLGIRDEPLLLAVLHPGGEQHPGAVTVDLLAPIAANRATGAAAQVVLVGDWPLRAPLGYPAAGVSVDG